MVTQRGDIARHWKEEVEKQPYLELVKSMLSARKAASQLLARLVPSIKFLQMTGNVEQPERTEPHQLNQCLNS